MDEVELECLNLLRDLGVPSDPSQFPPAQQLELRGRESGEKIGVGADPSEERVDASSRSLTEMHHGSIRERERDWESRGQSASPDPRYPLASDQERETSFESTETIDLYTKYPRDGHDPYTLYLKEMDPGLQIHDLRSLFSPFGQLIDVRIRLSGRKTVGFVQFKRTLDGSTSVAPVFSSISPCQPDLPSFPLLNATADRALEKMNHTVIGSKRVAIIYAQRRSEPPAVASQDPSCRTLLVSSIDPTLKSSDVQQAFERFERVLDIQMLDSSKRRPIIIAFLIFENASCAARAREAMDGKTLGSRTMTVSFARKERLVESPSPSSFRRSSTRSIDSITDTRSRPGRSRSRSPISRTPLPRHDDAPRTLICQNLPHFITVGFLKERLYGCADAWITLLPDPDGDSASASLRFRTREAAEFFKHDHGTGFVLGSRRISLYFQDDLPQYQGYSSATGGFRSDVWSASSEGRRW